MLKQWLCSPSCDPQLISLRLDAVEDFLAHVSLLAEIKEKLKKLPDLERLLRKLVSLWMREDVIVVLFQDPHTWFEFTLRGSSGCQGNILLRKHIQQAQNLRFSISFGWSPVVLGSGGDFQIIQTRVSSVDS